MKLSFGVASVALGKGFLACSAQAQNVELMPCSAQVVFVLVLCFGDGEDPARFRRKVLTKS